MEQAAALAFQGCVGGGAPLQILPQLPGFIGWGVAVQHLVAGGGQAGV